MYSVTAGLFPSIPLAVVRRTATKSELARLVPECCGLVWNALTAQGVRGGRHVAVYWDSQIRVEVGAEVSGAFDENEHVVRSATPAGLTATTTHFGPYSGLGDAHDAIQRWCRENGHRVAGPKWEIYGHWLPEWDANPSRVRTDVFCQLVAPQE